MDKITRITKVSDIQDSSLLTIQEVASILRVDHATVRRWTENGALEVVLLPSVGDRKLRRIKGSVIKKLLGNS